MSQRVSPTDKIRAQIDALFDGCRELVEIIEDLARLGGQLIIQTAVEAEVTEFLGAPATSAWPPTRAAATATARRRSKRPPAR